jgi:arylsulfatase A-like enzyme
MGLPSFATPNIDSIALDGVQFNNMYAGGTVCTPSRASLMTGFHSLHTIIDRGHFNTLRAGDLDRTWGQLLQGAGYETGWFGKWHLGGLPLPGAFHALPTQKGFETAYGSMGGTYRSAIHYENNGSGGMKTVQVPGDSSWSGPGGPYVYGEDLVADRAELFVRQQAMANQPFAAYVAFIEPHADVTMVPQDHPYVNELSWPKGDRDYAGIMSKLDAHVGQILDALDDPNGDGNMSDSVADNTLLVFTSDNGPVWNNGSPEYTYEFFNSNGIYPLHKWTTGDGGVRTPFFARWAGKIAPGTVNNSHVGSFADIMPTIAELTGQDAPLGIDGRSMVSDLLGGLPTDRRDALIWFTERPTFAGQLANHAVRVGDWKLYVHSPSTDANGNVTKPPSPWKLFNLAADPGEATNLLNSRPDIVTALQTIMTAEGGLREPTLPWFSKPPPGRTDPETVNTYFTQYKTWAPQGGSTNFFAAGNWSGGTQDWLDNPPAEYPEMPDAQNWNTGPGDNWLATMANTTGAAQQVTVNSAASFMALEVSGTSTLTLHVNSGVKLSARNGVRVSSGGVLRVHNGEVNTIRDLEIRPGGRFEGEGLVNGQQAVIAGIPEFAGLGLFEPRMINRGLVKVVSDADASFNAGRLLVQGDYSQLVQGQLELDIFSTGGVAGLNFDQLSTTGKLALDGILKISTPNPAAFAAGNTFQIISAAGGRSGVFSNLIAPALPGNLAWALRYTPSGVQLGVVDSTVHGGPFDYLSQFRQAFGVNADGDLDGDGDTDGSDLFLWQRSVFTAGATPVGAGVPEPSSTTLILTTILGTIAASRRRVGCQRATSRPS